MQGSADENVSSNRIFFYIIFAVLWIASFITAMAVVFSTFKSRQEIQALENLRREAASMQVMSGQYLLEKSSWAAYTRVESIAREKLDMRPPESSQTVLVYKK